MNGGKVVHSVDRTDYRILNLLQQDCRKTLRAIGEEVGLTPPAVAERIRKLEEDGVIEAYRIRIDRTRLDCSMAGFIMVAPEPEKYAAFCAFCERAPEITEHCHVIGNYNAMLRFAVKDTNALDNLLTQIKTYGDSRTSVELKTYFSAKELPLL
ncbi:MAG: Lrp/AsnC family transcriptional regulator [Oscillospiraceae bacterium]|nr:Lrp/AsnC family transcriptional regulator [Oscillospiraceae bacterium]